MSTWEKEEACLELTAKLGPDSRLPQAGFFQWTWSKVRQGAAWVSFQKQSAGLMFGGANG